MVNFIVSLIRKENRDYDCFQTIGVLLKEETNSERSVVSWKIMQNICAQSRYEYKGRPFILTEKACGFMIQTGTGAVKTSFEKYLEQLH